MKLLCAQCLKPFESAAGNALYCTAECRRAFAKAEKDHARTRRQASYSWVRRPSSGGRVYDLGLQEDRFR